MTQDELAKAIGNGQRPNYEDDSMRSWRCGCYEDQGGYHLCLGCCSRPTSSPCGTESTDQPASAPRASMS